MNDAIAPGAKASLGDMDQHFYYGDTTIEYFSKIKGVMHLWGNAFLPVSYGSDPFSFFEDNGNFPGVISFHGKKDNIAPIGFQEVYFSPDEGDHIPYHSENNCIPSGNTNPFVAQDGDPLEPDLYSFGSQTLHEMLNDPNAPLYVPNEIYVDCEMIHGLDFSCNLNKCSPGAAALNSCATYITDFATGFKFRAAVVEYEVQRSVTFFQSIVNGNASQISTRAFINCVNYRHNGLHNGITCNPANNNAGCSNTNTCSQ